MTVYCGIEDTSFLYPHNTYDDNQLDDYVDGLQIAFEVSEGFSSQDYEIVCNGLIQLIHGNRPTY